MWCHLCKINFTDFETFKCHITEKHRPGSDHNKISDSEESEEEVDDDGLENSDVEIYCEDNVINSEDDTLFSSERNEERKSNSPKPSTSNLSQNQNTCGFRKSSRIKKPTFKLRSYISLKNSDSKKAQNAKNSEPAVNNELYVLNPTANEMLDQQPMYVINPLSSDTSQLNSDAMFTLNSENILSWLTKHKELCKNLKYPLPLQLYKKIKMINKKLATHYCLASPSEENKAILKVYEDLNNMILNHITSIHDEL